VVIGRADIFEAFNPKMTADQGIRHSGTWNANPVLCAAGVAACKLYLGGEPQKKANELGAYLREKGNELLKARKISGHLYGRTIIHLYLGPFDTEPLDYTKPPTRDVKKIMDPKMAAVKRKLCLHLLQRGVATMGGETLSSPLPIAEKILTRQLTLSATLLIRWSMREHCVNRLT